MAREVKLQNPHLERLETDHLYHLGLSTKDDLEGRFSDVRFVCVGGTAQRMKAFAEYLKTLLEVDDELVDLTKDGHRYSMFKVGPILSINHGIGGPSFSILLHEMFKLLKYAKCKDVIMIRIGTSGGVGVPGGTVVVSTGAVNDLLKETHQFHVLGEVVNRPSTLDEALANDITTSGSQAFPDTVIVNGKTMCATDFYEAQGRLDGAFCSYDEAKKIEFLSKLQRLGVRNIEMEASLFAAMCAQANIRAAIVCVTLLNRLDSDQMIEDKEVLHEWTNRPQRVVGAYLVKMLRGG
ncbi:uridine phosphorylase 1-like [Tropilaelaps mercedesae]|uniref:Uridine phosphorylase 1-like n=1 Tax=Tropilaelaps mercedesae TaxID=418985 RepID=A0A1V9XH25_9ACAR|nr:uridine phosphorylase 1-like [Tropilaelaps mercedesae]